jgi:hypothetical protein
MRLHLGAERLARGVIGEGGFWDRQIDDWRDVQVKIDCAPVRTRRMKTNP